MKTRDCYIVAWCAFAFFILQSCITSESEGFPAGEPDAEEAYLSMNLLTQSLPETRASDEEIDALEHCINEIWMLLYNESDKLEYKFVWKVQNYQDADPTQLINFYNVDGEDAVVSGTEKKLGFTSVAQKVKRKQYKMAVLANPQGVFGTIDINSDLSLLTAAIDAPASSTLFFMSNANGLITVTKDMLRPTQEEAQTNPVAINLDRLLAKVVVKEKTGGITITTPDVVLDAARPIKWYLDVINKQTYPIRKFTFFEGAYVLENETNSVLAGRAAIYAEDPNFTPASNTESAFVKLAEGATPIYAAGYQYVPENTLNLATQSSDDWRKYTTAATVNAYLIYEKILNDPTNLNNEDDPGRNYYSCLLEKNDKTTEWRIFTHEQAKYWLQTGFPTSADAGTAEVLDLMEQKIREVQQDYIDGYSGAFNFLAATSPGKGEDTYRSYKQVTYHPLGLNKYYVPIRHFNNIYGVANPRKEVYGYYGVVRNNMYTITINSIAGPGIGIYDWDNRFLSTEIAITPWYKRSFQGEDLE